MTIRVLLIDDHDLIRGGLRGAFERDGDFEVVEDDAPSTDETVSAETSADRSMHERALELGARFSAEHRVPTGTRICVTLGGTPP